MRFYFGLCLSFFIFMNNISWGQSYECDNNFEQCGTPDQSGGGGGGKGSVLIANTDLGDSYQHADDYDDDGVEDSYDNCMRYPNPDQLDMDGDGRGDMCDNCLEYYNPMQDDFDGDDWGDGCDDDTDGDGILDKDDGCPMQWGNTCTELYIESSNYDIVNYDNDKIDLSEQKNLVINHNKESCDQKQNSNAIWILLVIIISLFFIK